MTILEARRKILSLQAKLDSLSYNQIFKKIRLYYKRLSKQKTKNRITAINWAYSKIYTQQQNLQNKIQYYLEILKHNPYKITARDLAISHALGLMNKKNSINENESINKNEENKIIKLENNYEQLVAMISQFNFNSKKKTEPVEQLNRSMNPYKTIKNRIVDIRFDIKIIDIDITQHSAAKWAEIYHLKLYNSYKYNRTFITEYEFCWALENKLQYQLLNDEIAEQKELRAKLIYMDIINNATEEEKEKIKNKFIYTLFIQKQLNYLYT